MRPDANQSQIVAALRAAGATVTILAGVGGGCPDIIAGWHGHNYFFEIKNSTGRGNRLTEAQTKWIERWAGQIAVVYNEQDALAVLYGSYE
jgi:Holliday junction resolvase